MIVEIEIPDLAELAGPDAFKDEDNPRVVGRAAISDLYFEEGDEIKRGELFAVIFNECGTYEIFSPAMGRLVEIRREEGDTVASEEVLANIEVEE